MSVWDGECGGGQEYSGIGVFAPLAKAGGFFLQDFSNFHRN